MPRTKRVTFTVDVDLDALAAFRRAEAAARGMAYVELVPADVWPWVRRHLMTQLANSGWPPYLVPPLRDQSHLWAVGAAAASVSERPGLEAAGA